MADNLPPYRVYACEGGWRISTPSTRKFPSRAKRAAVYPYAYDALFMLRNDMHIPWREIGWMWTKERKHNARIPKRGE